MYIIYMYILIMHSVYVYYDIPTQLKCASYPSTGYVCECTHIFSRFFFQLFMGTHFLHQSTRDTRCFREGLLRRHRHVFGPCQKDRNARARYDRPLSVVCIHCVQIGPHQQHDLDLFGDKNGMQFCSISLSVIDRLYAHSDRNICTFLVAQDLIEKSVQARFEAVIYLFFFSEK